ncbi:hypothetical protein Tco_1465554 [Tanacetum coccineum]
MSSASSAVTYTFVYTDSEPGRAFWGADDEEVSEGGIPWVIVYGYDGLPIQPVAHPSPDYIPGPEDPQTPPVPQDEDEQDGPVDYPMDRGDDGDDDDGDSSRDDADDKDEDEEDKEDEQEEEHLAPADSAAVVPTGERLARYMAPPTHSLPPLVPSPLPPSSRCPTQVQTLRMVSTQALIDALTAALPSPLLPPLPPSLHIPPPVDHRDDIPKSEQPPHKRLRLPTLGSRYEVGESSTARPTKEAVPELAPVTLGEVSTRVVELAEVHEHDIQDVYALLEDVQDGDRLDGGGGGLCFLRGLGSFDRIESDMRREMRDMQTELLAHREQQRRARQPGPEARIPDHQDIFGDADSHI